MSGIPVYVISFNQPTYLRNMIGQLHGLGVPPEEIHVVDNASTSPPLRDYLGELESQGHQVHRMARNLGPYVVFHPESGLHLPSRFAVTDPDLQFDARMPSNFRADLAEIARRCGTWKAGCALTLRDADLFLPGPYFKGRSIREWESAFWNHAVPDVTADLGGEPVYRAPIDTTFAVYLWDLRPEDFRPNDLFPDGFFEAVRVAGRYECRHLPWYASSFAVLSGATAAAGNPVRFDDGRIMVRPGPCEVDHYRRGATGSTAAALSSAASAGDYVEVSRPEDGYTFAVAPWRGSAMWWTQHFATGWQAPTFRILRERLTSPLGPTRLLDLGASTGGMALWSALRCEHVFCVEADAASVRELRENVTINRFEHRVTVVRAIVSPGSVTRASMPLDGDEEIPRLTLDALCRCHGVPLDSGNLVVKCNIGGGEELLLGDLLAFVVANQPVVGTLLVAMHMPHWRSPDSLARILDDVYARHPALRRWQTHSEHLDPLRDFADILRYVLKAPLGWLLWTSQP
jgi:hypothetical protein